MTAAPPVASLLDLRQNRHRDRCERRHRGWHRPAFRWGRSQCRLSLQQQPAGRRNGAEAIRSAARQAVACRADISSGRDSANLVAQAISHFGGVDILVNNADRQPVEMLAEMSESNWKAMMGENVAGPFC